MSPARTYAVLPDRGVCLHPGCPWHRDGPSAEPMGFAHAQTTGHEVRVQAASIVTFGTRRQIKAGVR